MDIDYARFGGILMHITSLPSKYGIGDFGENAYRFADKLKATGATLWQILPLGPTGYGNSPYAARSTFAGNELLLDIDTLIKEGYLKEEDVKDYPSFPSSKVLFDEVIRAKLPLLMKGAENFLMQNKEKKAYEEFKKKNKYWLDDYAVFMVLYNKHNDARWMLWEEKYSQATIRKHKEEAEIYKVLQYFFQKQWIALKEYANGLGIRIIGDIPIFVGADSADTWANIELFKTDEEGHYSAVSGVPPDNFCSTGQLWGNPVYDWQKHIDTDFSWWLKRVERQLELTDILRIDHFRGFAAYWEVPSSHKTAEKGKWKKAPGKEFFKTLREKMGELPIIAEDLGFMTEDVNKLRNSNHLPGMKICQFGFTKLSDGSFNAYDTFLPHNYEKNFVAYTGTHDNETARGWYESQDEMMKHYMREYLSSCEEEIVWAMIKAVMLSCAQYAIFPMQDLLGKDNSARMNTPSTCNEFNWTWRLLDNEFSPYVINRMKLLIRISGRNGLTIAQKIAE